MQKHGNMFEDIAFCLLRMEFDVTTFFILMISNNFFGTNYSLFIVILVRLVRFV